MTIFDDVQSSMTPLRKRGWRDMPTVKFNSPVDHSMAAGIALAPADLAVSGRYKAALSVSTSCFTRSARSKIWISGWESSAL